MSKPKNPWRTISRAIIRQRFDVVPEIDFKKRTFTLIVNGERMQPLHWDESSAVTASTLAVLVHYYSWLLFDIWTDSQLKGRAPDRATIEILGIVSEEWLKNRRGYQVRAAARIEKQGYTVPSPSRMSEMVLPLKRKAANKNFHR